MTYTHTHTLHADSHSPDKQPSRGAPGLIAQASLLQVSTDSETAERRLNNSNSGGSAEVRSCADKAPMRP